MEMVIKHNSFSLFREERVAEAIRDAILSCMSDLDSVRSLINIEDRYFFRSFCRPTVGDATRVIGCDVDVLACALASAGCIEYDPELGSEETSRIHLSERSVKFLIRYNYNKLRKYYLASVKDVESMSEEERRTFDKFVKSYSFSSKNRRVQRANRIKIEREFLRELFTPLTVNVIYDLTQTEAEAIGDVRKSSKYKSLFIDTLAKCHIKVVPLLRRNFSLLTMLMSLRYHIFSSEPEDNDNCAYSKGISYNC